MSKGHQHRGGAYAPGRRTAGRRRERDDGAVLASGGRETHHRHAPRRRWRRGSRPPHARPAGDGTPASALKATADRGAAPRPYSGWNSGIFGFADYFYVRWARRQTAAVRHAKRWTEYTSQRPMRLCRTADHRSRSLKVPRTTSTRTSLG